MLTRELLAPTNSGFWRQLLSRPLVIAIAPLLLLSIIAARSRFGALAGGALTKVGDSAFAYLQFYSQSWHAIGVGSGRVSHPSPRFWRCFPSQLGPIRQPLSHSFSLCTNHRAAHDVPLLT